MNVKELRHVLRVAAAGLWICLLAGCAGLRPVGPDYRPPEVRLPDRWQAQPTEGLPNDTAPHGTASLESWWDVFDDPALDDLIARARTGNPGLKAAVARVEEARAGRGIARSQGFPTLSGRGSAQATRSRESNNEDVYGLGLGVAWELDVWGRVRRLTESSQANQDAVLEDYRDVMVLLFAEVALAYTDVRSYETRIALAEENVRRQRETQELTRIRFQAGLSPELDTRQAELNLARTEALVPQLRAAHGAAVNRLGALIGEGSGAACEAVSRPARIPRPPDDVLVGIPADVMRQRPDVRSAERRLAAQTARIGVARSDLYPQLSLPGALSLDATSSDDVFEGSSRAWNIGPVFQWNLFTAGRVRNLIRVETWRTEQALQAYVGTVLRAGEEVENAMVAHVQEMKRRDLLAKAVVAAEQSVELVHVLYRSGLTDFQNVLNMEQALTLQQDELTASEGRRTAALIRLYKALGGGWDVSVPARTTTAIKKEEKP